MSKDRRTKAELIAELEVLQASTDGVQVDTNIDSTVHTLLKKVDSCGDSQADYHELRDGVIKDFGCDSRQAQVIINNCKLFIQASNNLEQLLAE